MNTGRRGFLKGLSAFVAGLTLQGRLRAQDAKLANHYVRKFKENSIPQKPVDLKSLPITGNVSGYCCVTGMWPPIIYSESGSYATGLE
jgi:hypothetical protein